MARVAVFGDIGGHLRQLTAALVSLGADPDTLALPADLQVVQVGDLIHRGPHSPEVVAFVDRMLTDHPGQWHQLAGNHEGQYVDTPAFDWPEVLRDDAQATLRAWWADGRMRVAAAIETGDGEQFLATHAGLTAGLHRRLGRPATAARAAESLNALAEKHPTALWRAGTMLGGGERDHSAGPMWAEAGSELAGSWIAAESQGLTMPFHQVHGHSSAVVFHQGQLLLREASLRDRVRVDTDARHVIVPAASGLLIGIDPGFGTTAHSRWAPLVLPDATVVG